MYLTLLVLQSVTTTVEQNSASIIAHVPATFQDAYRNYVARMKDAFDDSRGFVHIDRVVLKQPLVHLIQFLVLPHVDLEDEGKLGLIDVHYKTHGIDMSANEIVHSATAFRALAARANSLAQDRPDLSYAGKELCRQFAVPTTDSLEQLKTLIRYLIRCPRIMYHFKWQERSPMLNVYVDTDFAGCRVSRRSTSGGVAFRSGRCLRHWSRAQPTLAFSSGEAELGGLCKGATHGIGLRSMALDIGIELQIHLRTDATAAIGMSRQLGVRRVRHLDTSLLWLQNKVRSGDIALHKVPGSSNCADMLTKHVDRSLMEKHLASMNITLDSGRPNAAPQLVASCVRQYSPRSHAPMTPEELHSVRARVAERAHQEKCAEDIKEQYNMNKRAGASEELVLPDVQSASVAEGQVQLPDGAVELADEEVFVDEDHDDWAYAHGRWWRRHPSHFKDVC